MKAFNNSTVTIVTTLKLLYVVCNAVKSDSHSGMCDVSKS